MLGKIVQYDSETQIGVIKCGATHFEFDHSVWKEEETPVEGDHVFFNQRRNRILEIRLANDFMPTGDPVKSKWIAGLLGIFLGAFGAGRFYLGYYKTGIMQFLLSIATIPFGGIGILWGFVDGVLILVGQVIRDSKNRPLK